VLDVWDTRERVATLPNERIQEVWDHQFDQLTRKATHTPLSFCSQFQQHFMSNFFSYISSPKYYKDKLLVQENYVNTFIQKAEHQMLIKLTPGVNFINILCSHFTCQDPQSVNIQSSCQYLFTLLGSEGIKAAHKTLMKLTPDVGNPGMRNQHHFPMIQYCDI